MSLKKIISGGQTGADIAGVDAAIINGIPYGGWLPKGRKTENGPLDQRYSKMSEMPAGGYQQITEKNVVEADGTVIFTHGKYTGVSALTCNYAKKNSKPVLHLDLDVVSELAAIESLVEWIYKEKIEILNVAGSRESKDETIYDDVHSIIKSVLNILKTAEVVSTTQTPPASEPDMQTSGSEKAQAATEEVAAQKGEDKKSGVLSGFDWTTLYKGLSSISQKVKAWSSNIPEIKGRTNNIKKKHIYITLGILALAVVLLNIPRGPEDHTSGTTTTKTKSLSESKNLNTSKLSSNTAPAQTGTPTPQNAVASKDTTSSSDKAETKPESSDSKTEAASVAVARFEKMESSQLNDPIENASDKTTPKFGDKKEPLHALSNTSAGTEEKDTPHVHAKKRPSKNRNRCGSLYKKIASGVVLKKSEAKFLANHCK